ncbi:MAG: type II secretion system F family protein [Candidatus Bathyarchaeota archaeon]|nr:type II secretion system F family protein [Candidatus Bathyarchaeota archaeon]
MARSTIRDFIINISFRIFSKCIPSFTTFKQVYQKSGLGLIYESYMAVAFFVCTLVFILTFIVSVVIHNLIFLLPPLQCLVPATLLSFITLMTILIFFIAHPLWRVRQRKADIEANLVYTTGFMGVLASGGISIERIFNRIAEVEPHASINSLAKRIVANVRLFGLDVISAMEDVRQRSPSETFAKLMVGLVNTIKTSGDLKSLLLFETGRLLSLKREQLKKITATLIALAEIYVTVMVMAPITFIIMLTILSVLGTSQFGLSTAMQLNLVVFFGLPVICILFIVVLDGALPKEE